MHRFSGPPCSVVVLTGTYNNQYMIVDLKKVTIGWDLADDTLWVIEQMPGLVVGEDQTTVLRAGLLRRRSRQRERIYASILSVCLSVCPFVCRQNAVNAIF